MVDVDGVLIRHDEGQRWDSTLSRDLGIDPVALDAEFFARHFKDVILGRADLEERLGLALTKIASNVGVHQLMDYWFSHDAPLDAKLLGDLRDARRQGLQLHLVTVQEHHRARYLWETLNLRADFDAMHYAAELGCAKPDVLFFRAVERRVQLRPEELLLIDDRQENVEAAASCGWGAHLWTRGSTLNDTLINRPGLRTAP